MKQARSKNICVLVVVKLEAEFFYEFVLLMVLLSPFLNQNIRPNKKCDISDVKILINIHFIHIYSFK